MDLDTLEQANTIYNGIVIREKIVTKLQPLIEDGRENITGDLIEILQSMKDKGYNTELDEIVKPLISGSIDAENENIDQLYNDLYIL